MENSEKSGGGLTAGKWGLGGEGDRLGQTEGEAAASLQPDDLQLGGAACGLGGFVLAANEKTGRLNRELPTGKINGIKG